MTNDPGLKNIDVSVIIPCSEPRHDDLLQIFKVHKNILDDLRLSYEFIIVFDGCFPSERQELESLLKENPCAVKIISFSKTYGEAQAIKAAFTESSGKLLLTIPAYFQVSPEGIRKLFNNFNDDIDVLVGQRYPRHDNLLNRFQSIFFHGLINSFSGESFHDISCGIRLMRRQVLERINLYGDMHRFIPLLAIQKGFKSKEIPLLQAKEDIHLRVYGPGVYLRRLLDILTLFFLIKFTQKPLRFFGLLGFGISCIGLIITLITFVQRWLGYQGLSNRPLFLVGVLFLLIGLQTFFIGLVAEIIIFIHQPAEPNYNIEQIIE